jgi:hypothetical protein
VRALSLRDDHADDPHTSANVHHFDDADRDADAERDAHSIGDAHMPGSLPTAHLSCR